MSRPWLRRELLRTCGGSTLMELVAVMATLLTVLTAVTAVFISGSQAELDLSRRFQAQQGARLALDRLRREIHCASSLTLTSTASVSVTLPSQCPTAGGVQTTVVFDTQQVSSSRYVLRRAGIEITDYLTSGEVFSYVSPSTSSLGKLQVDFPVNVNPSEGWKSWRLVDEIVLRNSTRS